MSSYVEGTTQFSMATFASLIGTNASRVPTQKVMKGKAIVLAHDDTPDEMCVGGFANFRRIFEANSMISTGNRVYEDESALPMITKWRSQFPNAMDLSKECGCASFTEVVMNLVHRKLFSIDSVIKFAKNPYNMESILIKNGLMEESNSSDSNGDHGHDKTNSSSGRGAFESVTKTKEGFQNSILSASVNSDSGKRSIGLKDRKPHFSSSTPNVLSSESLGSQLMNKIKRSAPVVPSKLSVCFSTSAASDEEDDDQKPLSKRVCRKIEFKDDGIIKKEEVVDLCEEDSEDMSDDWKLRYEHVVSHNEELKREIHVKSSFLEETEKQLASLQKEREEERNAASLELEELDNRYKQKIKKLEDELKSISDINDEEGDSTDIRVSKELFEKLMDKVTKIDKALNKLPSKENLKEAVDYMDTVMNDRLSQMKEETKEMLSTTCDEIVKKYE